MNIQRTSSRSWYQLLSLLVPATSLRHGRSLVGSLALILSISLAVRVRMVAQPITPMLSAGWHLSIALHSNGTVYTWGNNTFGSLGIGYVNAGPTASPQLIASSNLSNVVAVTGGGGQVIALQSNGSVKAWGGNNVGQLGLGSTTHQSTPQAVSVGSLNTVAITAGGGHCMAALSDGTVNAWGYNSHGQLGLGNTINQLVPVQIPPGNLSNITTISSGYAHSLALRSDGTVVAWGCGCFGALGLGNLNNQSSPQLIPANSLSNVIAIAAGDAHSLALLANGTVMAWGNNAYGQLGLGNTGDHVSPQQIPPGSLSGVVAIASGSYHSIALLSDGSVMTWGYNNYGQLGLGHFNNQFSPQSISSTGMGFVSGIASGYWHCLAMCSNGTLKAWGSNLFGELGFGYASTTGMAFPQPVPNFCLFASTAYSLQFGPLGNSALGMTIPCNSLPSGLSGQHYYFNTFSADTLNATLPGAGGWHGLHTTQTEVLAWLNWGVGGFTLALGPLTATGGAQANLPASLASLSGLTVYGVSVAFNPVSLAVVASSTVASYTF